jgi:hypothetical protein
MGGIPKDKLTADEKIEIEAAQGFENAFVNDDYAKKLKN